MKENDIISKQSEQASNAGRQIAFALIAVTWSLSKNDEKISIYYFTGISMIAIVAYLALDMLQYFITTIRYRKIENSYAVAIDNCTEEKSEGINSDYIKKKARINTVSYNLFVAKFIFIPISVISLMLYLICRFFSL